METCRICQQKCSEEQQFCKNCGYPLTKFPPTLGEIPQAFQDILAQRETWEKQIWQKYSQMRSQKENVSQQNKKLQAQVKQLQRQENQNKESQQTELEQFVEQLQGKASKSYKHPGAEKKQEPQQSSGIGKWVRRGILLLSLPGLLISSLGMSLYSFDDKSFFSVFVAFSLLLATGSIIKSLISKLD
jgi:hypothetical protein